MSTIKLTMLAETQSINKGIKDVNNQLTGFGKTAGKVGGLMKTAFVAAGAAVAGAKIGGFLKDSVAAASDLNETISKTETIFGSAAADILKFGDDASKSLGLSKQAALDGVSTFGNFFNQIGIGSKQSAKFSKSFVKMSSDLASFNNADPAAVMDSLAAATRGEYDSLQKYIPTINAAKVEQEAMLQTGKESAKALTDQDKAIALHTLAVKGMGKAQGDFARTSGGLANQQRMLSAQFADVKAQIGQALLPVVLKVVTFINKNMIPAFKAIGDFLGPVIDKIKEFASAGSGGASAFQPLVTFIQEQVVPAVMGIVAAYQNLYNTLAPIVGQIVAVVVGKWSEIKPALTSVWESIKTIITSALSIIQSYVRIGTAVVSAIWEKFGANILRYISSALSGVLKIVKGAFQIIAGIFKTVSSLLKGDWKGAWDGIKQILSGALNIIKGLIQVSFAQVRLVIGAAWTAVKTITSAAWNGIKSAVSKAIEGMMGFVKAIPGKVKGALSNLGGLLKDAGIAIIQGLIDGIESKIGEVTGMLTSLTDKIPDWKGPKSRDRTLLTENGQLIMQSLINGFEKGRPDVESFLGTLTETISSTFATSYSKQSAQLTRAQKTRSNALEASQKKDMAALTNKLKAAKASSKAINKAQNELEKVQDKQTKNLGKKQNKQQKLLENAYKAAESKVIASLKAESKALEKVLDQRDKIAEKLDEATAKLEQMKQVATEYATSVKNSILDFGSLGSLNSAFTSDAMTQQLQARIEKVRKFSSVLATLRAQGLNDSMYKQLVDAGVEGGLAYAEAIAQGGPAAIGEFNTLQSTLDAEAASLGATASANLYAAGIQAQQGLVDGLQSQYAALDNEALVLSQRIAAHAAQIALIASRGMELAGNQTVDGFIKGLAAKDKEISKWARSVAKAMTKAIKDQLGIKSPSRVFKAIGQYTTKGLAIGLQDVNGVTKAVSNIAEAMTGAYDPAFATASIPGAAAPVGSGNASAPLVINLNGTFVGTSKEQVGRWFTEAQDAYLSQGGRRAA